LKGVGNALGTVWNNWQTDWVGEPVTTVEQPPNRTVTRNRRAQWGATPRGRARSFPGRAGGVTGMKINAVQMRFEVR
jgi:hypothetical protein